MSVSSPYACTCNYKSWKLTSEFHYQPFYILSHFPLLNVTDFRLHFVLTIMAEAELWKAALSSCWSQECAGHRPDHINCHEDPAHPPHEPQGSQAVLSDGLTLCLVCSCCHQTATAELCCLFPVGEGEARPVWMAQGKESIAI